MLLSTGEKYETKEEEPQCWRGGAMSHKMIRKVLPEKRFEVRQWGGGIHRTSPRMLSSETS